MKKALNKSFIRVAYCLFKGQQKAQGKKNLLIGYQVGFYFSSVFLNNYPCKKYCAKEFMMDKTQVFLHKLKFKG